MRIDGKVCLVTGGGSGIGRATCEQVAREGGRVLVIDINDAGGSETVHRIASAGGQALFAKADVSISSEVHAAIQMAVDAWQQIDKGGMEALTRGFGEELDDRKIRINCVAPGAVDTPMRWNNPNVKSGAEKIEGAIGKPENIAAAICLLAADESAFVTGTTPVVDGGRLDIL